MAKITDPDLLAQGVEVVFDTSAKTIQLLVAGDLSNDGITGQCVYSFCKEEWKSDANLIKFPFPLIAITEQKFDLVNGWDWKDTTTRNLIRDAGWCLRDANNVSLEEYMGFVSLGTIGASDQVYYQQSSGGSSTNIVLTGPANQAVKIYGDATHGNFNYRSFFKCFVREQAKIYDQSQLSAIGLSAVTYQVYAFPLSNSTDLDIAVSDNTIDTTAPYTGMSITYLAGTGFAPWANSTVYAANAVVSSVGRWYITTAGGTSNGTGVADDVGVTWVAYTGERSIGGTYRAFNIIVDGNTGDKNEIYEFVQRQLRKGTDIDAGAGTVIGKTADGLLTFVGATLKTSTGVFIDDFSSVDTNSIDFYDIGGVLRQFPYVAAGTLLFNENLVNDADAVYRMYFTTNPAGNFGSANAVLVNNNAGSPISGVVPSGSIAFDFDYDGNVQGGRTAGTNADVTVVGIGLSTGQYVKATGTLVRSNANSISLVSALERNYSNPA